MERGDRLIVELRVSGFGFCLSLYRNTSTGNIDTSADGDEIYRRGSLKGLHRAHFAESGNKVSKDARKYQNIKKRGGCLAHCIPDVVSVKPSRRWRTVTINSARVAYR